MATINSNDDFVNACNYLIAQGQLTVTVARFIDASARKVYDETTPVTDITPDTATLETALDNANAAILNAANTQTEDATERATLLTQYNAALTQIGNDLADVANGRTALGNATTLAQVKPIVDGMLVILQHQLNREERELKTLRAILRSGLSGT